MAAEARRDGAAAPVRGHRGAEGGAAADAAAEASGRAPPSPDGGGSVRTPRSSSSSADPDESDSSTEEESEETALPSCYSVFHDLLSAKVIATIVGWLIMHCTTLTLLNMLTAAKVLVQTAGPEIGILVSDLDPEAQKAKTYGSTSLRVAVCFVLYVVSLFCTAAYALHVRKIHRLHGTLFGAALTMIPAWSWKDFVNRFILLSTNNSANRSTVVNVLHSVLLAWDTVCFSAALKLLADKYLDHVGDKATLLSASMHLLAESLSLGCGFAVNSIFKSSFENVWGDVKFQLVYTSVLSLVLPRVQQLLRERTSGINRPFSRRFCDFVVLSGNFLLSWAWKGFIDATFELAGHPTRRLAEPITVTLLGPVAVLAAARSRHRRLRDGVALVVGMNIGWAWLDWCNAGVLGSRVFSKRHMQGLWMGTLALLLPLLAVQLLLWHPQLAPERCLPRRHRGSAEEDEQEADMEVVDAGPDGEGS